MASVGTNADDQSAASHILRLESAIAHLQQHVLPASASAHSAELQRALTAAQLAAQTWRAAEAAANAVHSNLTSSKEPFRSVPSDTAASEPSSATAASSSSACSLVAPTSTTTAVSRQYDAFPYPNRDSADEREVLRLASPSNILELNHLVWRGRRDFALPLRVLVAGGGTGDSVVCLAQHLHDLQCPASITCVDLSRASLRVCAARLRKRRLPCVLDGEQCGGDDDDESTVRVRLVCASILDLAQLGLGDAFDYIDCCGVLHHLQQPHAGLRALVAALAPGGAIGVMMYGALGRTGVYAVQRLMRVLREARRRGRHHDQNLDANAEADMAWELDVLQEVLHHLPPTHPLRCNRAMMNAADLDSREGRVDLFLHACDTACDVDQLDALLHCAGLQVCARLPRGRADAELSLPTHTAAPHLRSLVGALSRAEEAIVCELFSGTHACHVVLATRASSDAIGALLPCTVSSFQDALEAAFEEQTHSAAEATELTRGGTAAVLPCSAALWAELRRWVLVPVFVYAEDIEQRYGAELALLSRAATRLVLRNFDGERTLQHAFDRYTQTESTSVGAFLADVRALWRLLEPRGLLCASLTPFPLLWEHSYK